MEVGQYIQQHYMRFRKIINEINKLYQTNTNKEKIKILDFASHTGVMGIVLKTFGYEIHCTDLENVIQANLDNYTKNDLKVRFLNNNWDRLPYPDDHFDCLIFSEVLEHLYESPIKYLEEFYRILKPDGYLLITTPNVMCWKTKSSFCWA
jgi:ubiquinone/menaquinone biosynthesis C-methylase UbiE